MFECRVLYKISTVRLKALCLYTTIHTTVVKSIVCFESILCRSRSLTEINGRDSKRSFFLGGGEKGSLEKKEAIYEACMPVERSTSVVERSHKRMK